MLPLSTAQDNPLFQAMEKKFDISGIPTLVVIRCSDSQVITPDGVEAVHEKGNEAVKDWV